MIGALIVPDASSRVPPTDNNSNPTTWFFSISTAAFSASLGVNAILSTLLAIKIYEVQRIAKESYTVRKHKVHPIRRLISIFNDSGMLMLGCQIIWLTFFRLHSVGFVLIRGPLVMIYVSLESRCFLPLRPVIKHLLFFNIGINTNVDLPTTPASNDSYCFKGETEKRPSYFGSLCKLKRGVVMPFTSWLFFFFLLFFPLSRKAHSPSF
jgi:hypothetical protein